MQCFGKTEEVTLSYCIALFLYVLLEKLIFVKAFLPDLNSGLFCAQTEILISEIASARRRIRRRVHFCLCPSATGRQENYQNFHVLRHLYSVPEIFRRQRYLVV